MSRIPIPKGGKIILYHANRNVAKELEIISHIYDEGNSCIVYEARDCNDEYPCQYRLKELYPRSIADIKRDSDNQLVIGDKAEYKAACTRFDAALNILCHFAYNKIEPTGSYVVKFMGNYYGKANPSNGIRAQYMLSAWTSSTYDNCVSKICETADVHTAAKICLKTAEALKVFHSLGYVNFDIKPENLLYSDANKTISFFDFDTVFKLEDAAIAELMYSEGSSPEIIQKCRNHISEKTDIYPIGSMLHKFIFNKHFDRGMYSSPKSSFKDKILNSDKLANSNPLVAELIDEILKNTNFSNSRKRYSDDELIEKLKLLCDASSQKAEYIIDQSAFYIKNADEVCADELYDLKQKLDENNYVFIQGLAGVKKNDFAEGYIKQFSEKYHTIVKLPFKNNLSDTISEIKFENIIDDDYNDCRTKLFEKKMNLLRNYNKQTLIVIENFEPCADVALLDELKTHILLTTSFPVDFPQKYIFTMSSEKEKYVNTKTVEEHFNMLNLMRTKATIFHIFLSFLLFTTLIFQFTYLLNTRAFSINSLIMLIITSALGTILRIGTMHYSEKKAIYKICLMNHNEHYTDAVEFVNNINNTQLIELIAPSNLPKAEKNRQKTRLYIGLISICLALAATGVSLCFHSFPLMVAFFGLIIIVLVAVDFKFSVTNYCKMYNDKFIGDDHFNETKILREIYRDQENVSDTSKELSTECQRLVMYNEYKTHCNIVAAINALLIALAIVNIFLGILAVYMPSELLTYLKLPSAVSSEAFLRIFTFIVSMCCFIFVLVTGKVYEQIKDYLFALNSNNTNFVRKKYTQYLAGKMISKLSFARGVMMFALKQFERDIPAYEIRTVERPTLRHRAETHKPRAATYINMSALILVSVFVWHFGMIWALIPIALLMISMYVYWFKIGVYKITNYLDSARKTNK